jgi:hypothetical protein
MKFVKFTKGMKIAEDMPLFFVYSPPPLALV